jgi:hypothetical protein
VDFIIADKNVSDDVTLGGFDVTGTFSWHGSICLSDVGHGLGSKQT